MQSGLLKPSQSQLASSKGDDTIRLREARERLPQPAGGSLGRTEQGARTPWKPAGSASLSTNLKMEANQMQQQAPAQSLESPALINAPAFTTTDRTPLALYVRWASEIRAAKNEVETDAAEARLSTADRLESEIDNLPEPTADALAARALVSLHYRHSNDWDDAPASDLALRAASIAALEGVAQIYRRSIPELFKAHEAIGEAIAKTDHIEVLGHAFCGLCEASSDIAQAIVSATPRTAKEAQMQLLATAREEGAEDDETRSTWMRSLVRSAQQSIAE